jgi:hypothetical protein
VVTFVPSPSQTDLLISINHPSNLISLQRSLLHLPLLL